MPFCKHTPEAVFDDDIDRQSATCTDCGVEVERVWVEDDDRLGRWSPWLAVNARSQSTPIMAVA